MTSYHLTKGQKAIQDSAKNNTALSVRRIGYKRPQKSDLQGYRPAILTRGYLDAGLMPGADNLTGPGAVNAEHIDAIIAGAAKGMR